MKGGSGIISGSINSGSSKVLPGPPKYLPHQCPHRVRLVPEIVPDPPLHGAQIILVLGIRSSILSRNVFGHYGGVDQALFRPRIRALLEL